MTDPADVSFAGTLKQLRLAAGLTQEELADISGVAARSISDLERGVNLTARKDTARLLADALSLDGEVRTAFEAIARGRPANPGVFAPRRQRRPRSPGCARCRAT